MTLISEPEAGDEVVFGWDASGVINEVAEMEEDAPDVNVEGSNRAKAWFST